MSIFKKSIAVLSAAVLVFGAVGCKHKIKSSETSNNTVTEYKIGVNKHEAEMSQEVNANETIFALNSVIDAGAQTENGEHYIYLDITIKNNTDSAYTLSTLNNFRLIMPDESEVYGHVRTQLYATNNFTDKYFGSPFDIPANGEFRGIVGGFVVKADQKDFTVDFFPTKENELDKEDVVRVKVDASKIVSPPADLIKN
ncbi:MAG: DUF4352 domain-containing protein [Ruminococcus sp.]|nr:DUF4352 domain-containing protein [Ruminococcus sp.]